MPVLRLVLGDQLTRSLSSLSDLNLSKDTVLMAEVLGEATYVRHHKQKIAFIFSAMRHFAEGLKADGVKVRYVKLDDKKNAGSLKAEVRRALKEKKFEKLVVTAPGEWRLLHDMEGWADDFGILVDIRNDDRFVASQTEFADWADGRKQLRMEYFYRDMRRKTGLLMDSAAEPEGGAWNYDADNRKKLPKGYAPPARLSFTMDKITKEVVKLVNTRFADHFGDLDAFNWPVTRDEALRALDHFIDDCLPAFGDYQDAMAVGETFLNHSLLSAALNIGLLGPLEVCEAAEEAYKDGRAPLNAVEGFIRQIIGWREYVRGLYWLKMPDYKETNHLAAARTLPAFYWTGDTDMVCMAEAIDATKRHAYAHHIQRLMVTGNFALLAGVAPDEINEWYLVVYADAFEWVQLPNTHGMAVYADGGVMASKPYAASGAYINRMSNYCKQCRYDVKVKIGDDACPFNALYWDFIFRNEKRLRANPRMGLVYKNADRMEPADKRAVRKQAKDFLRKINI
ncbi:MAG: cryptochrome/photolyase family protein [Pseudomonadota bacterium]